MECMVNIQLSHMPYTWNEVALINERKLARINTLPKKPSWFIEWVEATPFMDIAGGIDGYARIRYTNGMICDIPVQIKSSESGVRTYEEKRPSAARRGVVLLVVTLSNSWEKAALKLLIKLQEVRESGVPPREYWKWLSNRTFDADRAHALLWWRNLSTPDLRHAEDRLNLSDRARLSLLCQQ